VYSAISSVAFSSRSGGIEGRPTELYICSNTGDSVRSASSARVFTCLSGWSSGTLFSGVTRLSIDPCFVSLPLTTQEDHTGAGLSIPYAGFFSILLALCGGGLGVVLPGDLQVGGTIGKLRIEAAGGLGLCVIFYLLTPKILASAETSKRTRTTRKR
jgi:hypothetical protein